MTSLLLISPITQWGFLLLLCFVVVGLLQQIGLLHRRLERVPSDEQENRETSLLPLEKDGPSIGSHLSHLARETRNSHEMLTLTSPPYEGNIMLLFLTSTCKSCQDVVGPINKLVDEGGYAGRVVAILRDEEQGCDAFLNVFPLHIPAICDPDRSIYKNFGVHRSPFALLYDTQGILVRKGIVEREEDFLALLGNPSVTVSAQSKVFPPLSSPSLA